MAKQREGIFLLVEGGPVLALCQEWRASYNVALEAGRAFCRSMGSEGGYTDYQHKKLSGLYLTNPVPPGWIKVKGKRGQPDWMRPDTRNRDKEKKALGLAAQAALDALPGTLPTDPIREAIGMPGSIEYEYDQTNGERGRGYMSCGGMTFIFNPVQVAWAGDAIVIYAPDIAATVASLKAEHQWRKNVTIIQGDGWEPPEGVRRISEAEWDLIQAQWKVAREKAGETDED
jgi:hypothetical protein